MTDRSVVVAVPSYGRVDSLMALLAGLEGQEDPGLPWSVLIVMNDGTAPDFPAEVRPGVPVRVVDEPAVGAANARNRAVLEAGSPLIAFIDNDVVPEPDWLAEIVRPILAGEADATAGMVRLDPTRGRPWWWSATWMDPYLAAYDHGRDPRMLGTGEYFLTANACVPAESLRAIGGFDTSLGPSAGRPMVNDDVQVSRDLLARGVSIRWTPRAVVEHDVPDSRLDPRWLASRIWNQGRSDTRLARSEGVVTRRGGLALAARRLWDQVHGLRYRAGWSWAYLTMVAWGFLRVGGAAAEAWQNSPDYVRQGLAT